MNEIPKLGCKTDWSKDVKVLTSEISKCYEATYKSYSTGHFGSVIDIQWYKYQYGKRWRELNKDRKKAYEKKYREEHRKEINEYQSLQRWKIRELSKK